MLVKKTNSIVSINTGYIVLWDNPCTSIITCAAIRVSVALVIFIFRIDYRETPNGRRKWLVHQRALLVAGGFILVRSTLIIVVRSYLYNVYVFTIFTDAETQRASASRSSTRRPLHPRFQPTGDGGIRGRRESTLHTQVNVCREIFTYFLHFFFFRTKRVRCS